MEEGTSGSWRTRSQVAPDWTVKDCLILVNEIAVVEADCSNTLSSFQKWTMISENCNALDVHRTLNQCRRKWDALVSDYSQIKQWESQERGDGLSYWSLSTENRNKLKLPEDTDNELFEAINAVVMIQQDKAGTEPDSDPEAQEEGPDILDITAELGSKRSRHGGMITKENPRQSWTNQIQVNTKEQEPTKATHQKVTMEENHNNMEFSTDEEQDMINIEEEVKAMEEKLGEKAELIHAIVARNLAKESETENEISKEKKMKFVRQQGEELIDCLTEIVNSLHRLREVSEDFE